MNAHVGAVLTGAVEPLGGTRSGINKRPVLGPQRLERLGIDGDRQADIRLHGGVDKAVLCYAWAHYDYWRDALQDRALLDAPGAFGENLSVHGIDEHDVCIGDRWRVGSALLEVSQGRQPCFKLNLRFGLADMAARVQNSLRAGWYMRVLEPGVAAAGDALELVERRWPSHSVADLLALIRDREVAGERLEPVLQLPLTPSWRKLFERRLAHGRVEDWSRRMS